ncbi:unnamed protein product [Phytophthora fragariaefolia]|uniref:Unnamed protein product n=1 Tax=Phytophthora fragariaefolia TaxID=1490495 RepID=A0A9W7CRE2_9STRA|nr:unnamed protein product [Phytophthora fragariaefolia]
MTTDHHNVHVLLTGVSLPACCSPERSPSDAHCPSPSPPSRLLLVQVLRINSRAGLSYVSWKCTSSSPHSSALKPEKLHSQWIPQRHVALVHPATPSSNEALGRGPHDAKFEVDNPRVELWSSKSGTIGRFTVAKQCIRPGEKALQATAFAVIVRQSLAPRRCHWCFAVLRQKALQCGDCEFARYCSRNCLAADAPLHDFQCLPLRELKRRGNRAGVEDVETVRLVLAVLNMELFLRNPHALELLVVHRHRDSEEKAEMRRAVSFIVEMTGRVVDPKHVQATLERVRCNAHPLYLDGVTCVGTGVFPEAAMALNHSCLPNVVPSFDPRARSLAFHAVIEIPHGVAVECAYIDLLQARTRRQSLLAGGFGFDCICGRCTNEVVALQTKRSPVADYEDKELAMETRVMEQLMVLASSKARDTKQRIAFLRKEYEDVFERSDEAQFALYTTEMQLARANGDWRYVVETAEMLLEIWARCGLPACYHTTETLHLQLCMAATQAEMTEKARASSEQVVRIRRICGYPQPDTLVN